MVDQLDVVEIELAGWLQPVLRVTSSPIAAPRYFMLQEICKDGTYVGVEPVPFTDKECGLSEAVNG